MRTDWSLVERDIIAIARRVSQHGVGESDTERLVYFSDGWRHEVCLVFRLTSWSGRQTQISTWKRDILYSDVWKVTKMIIKWLKASFTENPSPLSL